MTNEALAELIQQGGNDELYRIDRREMRRLRLRKPAILWEKVQRLLFAKAERYYSAYSEPLRRYGYDVQDIRQECYSAMLAAIKWYKPDKEYKFTTYLNYSLKHTIRGLYSGKNDALNQAATMSLEQPIGEGGDGDELTVADTVADDTAAQTFEQIELCDYFKPLYEALETLTEKQRNMIQTLYFDGLSINEAAAQFGVSRQAVRSLEGAALRTLRSGKVGVKLRDTYGEDYGYYDSLRRTDAYHKSYAAFLSSHSSEVEDAALANITREYRTALPL